MISDEEYQAESIPAAADGRSASTVVARPALFGRLEELARVTVVSAPAGSGKSVLLRSWIAEAIGSRLGVPAVNVPADVLMLPARSPIWDNGHYFSAS
jgi:hypothetical protein